MSKTEKLLTIYIRGAGAKGRAHTVQGWGGVVSAWEDGKQPQVAFGKWQQTGKSYGGGIVTTNAAPGALLLYGANGKSMDPRDKFTYFGIASKADTGELECRVRLPAETPAKPIFDQGGVQLPTSDDEVLAVEKLRAVLIDPERPNDAFGEVLDLLRDYLLKRTFNQQLSVGSFQDRAKAIIERAAVIAANWPEHREFMEEVIKFMNEWLPIGVAYAERRRAEKTEKKLMAKLAQDGLAVK